MNVTIEGMDLVCITMGLRALEAELNSQSRHEECRTVRATLKKFQDLNTLTTYRIVGSK